MSEATQQGNEPQRWRVRLHGIDPDTAYRSVRAVHGFRSWADPQRTLYQVGTSTIEVYEQGNTGTLLINDANQVALVNTAARLGYPPETLTPTPIIESVRAARHTDSATT